MDDLIIEELKVAIVENRARIAVLENAVDSLLRAQAAESEPIAYEPIAYEPVVNEPVEVP